MSEPTIDAYIADAAPDVQPLLRRLRELVHEEIPDVEERISWGMPTFAKLGNVFHFAAYKRHIGLYPGTAAVEQSRPLLDGYRAEKGTVRLPLDRPVPEPLVRALVRASYAENVQTQAERKAAHKAKNGRGDA